MASLDGAAANLVGRRVKALGVPEHRLDTASVAALRLLEAAQAFETAAGGARAHVQLSNLTDNSDVVWARLHESLDGMRAGTPAARDAFSAALRHAWAPLVRTKVHVATPGLGVNGHPDYTAAAAAVPQTSVAAGYDASPAVTEQRRLSFSAEQAHVGATTATTPSGHTPASTPGATPGTEPVTRKRAPYLLRPTGVDRETWKSFTREQRLETVSQYNAVVGAPKRAKLDTAVAAPAPAAAAAPAASPGGAPAAGDEAAMIANAAVAAAAAAANVMEDGGGGGAGGAPLSTGAVSADMDTPPVGGSGGSGGGNHSGAGRPKTYLTRPRSVEVALWKSLNREQRLELVAKHAGVDAVMPTVKRTKPVGLAAQAVANSPMLDGGGLEGGEAAGSDGAVAATLNAPEGGEAGGGGGEAVMGDFGTTPFPEAT